MLSPKLPSPPKYPVRRPQTPQFLLRENSECLEEAERKEAVKQALTKSVTKVTVDAANLGWKVRGFVRSALNELGLQSSTENSAKEWIPTSTTTRGSSLKKRYFSGQRGMLFYILFFI
jgi:hypothetical protein